MTLLEALRYVNVILGVVCLVLMVRRLPVWRSLSPEWRLVGLGCGALVASTTFGTIELLVHRGPVGVRIPFTACALAWLLFGLLRMRHRAGCD